jgi:hypothetical protein
VQCAVWLYKRAESFFCFIDNEPRVVYENKQNVLKGK